MTVQERKSKCKKENKKYIIEYEKTNILSNTYIYDKNSFGIKKKKKQYG